jgi:hypothetical protein
MLNSYFQLCDPFVHMRKTLASVQGMLQRSFRMCQEFLCVTLFAMVYRFCRMF